jgi:hypothetical protein
MEPLIEYFLSAFMFIVWLYIFETTSKEKVYTLAISVFFVNMHTILMIVKLYNYVHHI